MMTDQKTQSPFLPTQPQSLVRPPDQSDQPQTVSLSPEPTPLPPAPQPQTVWSEQSVIIPAEKKRNPKKLLLLLIFLLLLLGSAGIVLVTGLIELPFGLAIFQPRQGAKKAPVLPEKTLVPITTEGELPKDKYLKDTDQDGFPDFIEEGTGDDSRVVDCVRAANCQATAGVNPKAENNVLFILDSSGSMAGQVNGQQKIAVAKQAIGSYVSQAPERFNTSLVVYGHQGSTNQWDKGASCAGTEVLYPLSQINKDDFTQRVDSFEPMGWTSIADSFRKARDRVFVGKEQDNNAIILVSDGIETCGGDPCGMARELASLGISPVIDVVGLDVNNRARVQLQCIARVANGQYFEARTAEDFNQAFERLKAKAGEFEKAAQCLNENFEVFATCTDKQVMASIEYLDREKKAALVARDNEKVAELSKVRARLNQKYEEFLTGFEKEYSSEMRELIE